MRRSLLFIPGNNPAMLQNADVFGSDAVIFDLEDAVNVTEKDNARNLIHYYLKTHTFLPMEVVIRINGLDTDYYLDDLDKVVSDSIDTIMLPKAKVQEVKELDAILSNLKKTIKIIPIIELAQSVLQVEEIASLNRVDGILLGAEDLSSDMEVARTKEGREIEYARCRVAMACKAYQIDAIDTPFTDVNDPVGLRIDAQNAQTFAMNAKSAIHPNQIDTINDVFLPAPKLINWAKRVKAASDDALSRGIGVFSLDGKMVDKPVIERALKILAKAEKFNAL